MPIHTAIWKVGPQPQPLAESTLATEQFVEDMIVAEPRLLSDEWMLIGRHEGLKKSDSTDGQAAPPATCSEEALN
jgi:hypothetical protein